jgi:hypothetical protein
MQDRQVLQTYQHKFGVNQATKEKRTLSVDIWNVTAGAEIF